MMMAYRFCIIMLAMVVLSTTSIKCSGTMYQNMTNKTSTPLYFGLMLSLSGDQQSTGALAGVQAALDHINSRDDLLPGYSLHYTLIDSEVTVATKWRIVYSYLVQYKL